MTLPNITGFMSPLEAVNICLVAANLAPVNSEIGLENNVAGYQAWSLILEESRQVQTEGWQFNTNYDVTLEPSANGEISLPRNLLKLVIPGGKYAVRGLRLYNRRDNTFIHTMSVTATRMVILLDWDELPQQARYYIAVRSARRFLAPRVGAEVAKVYSSVAESSARVVFEQADAELGEPNAEFHSNQVYTWKRRGR